MKTRLRHPLVKPLAVISAAAITAALIAVTNGQSASAVGPAHTTELAYNEPWRSFNCPTTIPAFAKINTAAYQRLRLLTRAGVGSDFTLTFSLEEQGEQWEIGKLAVPAGAAPQSTIIDFPGKTLVVKAVCSGFNGGGSLDLLAYGN